MTQKKLIDLIWRWGEVQGEIALESKPASGPMTKDDRLRQLASDDLLMLQGESERLWEKITEAIEERTPCKH